MASPRTAQRFLSLLQEASDLLEPGAKFDLGSGKIPARTAIDNLASCVVQRFIPVLVDVKPGELDRTASLVGGCGFVSESYPTPSEGTPGEPMAPMIQLDLDQVRASTGVNAGDGLLQVWIPGDCRGPGVPTYCRVIPRAVVARTTMLADCRSPSAPRSGEESIDEREIEILQLVDPLAARRLSEIAAYRRAWLGFDWGMHDVRLGKFPKQIVRWKADGFTVPGLDEGLLWEWYQPDGQTGGAMDALQAAAKLSSSEGRRRRTFALFEDESECGGFFPVQHDDPSTITGWRPLLCFYGPVADMPDEHVVLYRRKGRKFEYVSGCTR